MNAQTSTQSSGNGKPSFYALALLSVLFCYFTMGFVDIVGISSSYLKEQLNLSNSQANLFPSLLFFWFLIFSVPSSLLMNKIGRKNTVLISVALSLLAMFIPLTGVNFWVMLIGFSLLGIGNAIMQTSLNPLVYNVVAKEKVPSTLTFGQFLKAIIAFSGPILTAWGANELIPSLGLGWRIVFVIYAVIGIIALVWLFVMPIQRETADKVSGFLECVKLLAIPLVLLSFLGIICHVGIDVGINATAPRIFQERVGISLDEAGYALSVYFVCRVIGSLLGAALLQKMSAKLFFFISAVLLVAGLVGWIFLSSLTALYVCIALLGLGNSNIFPIIFSQVTLRMPKEANELSGLMVMGLFGGTVFPMIMGGVSDTLGSQIGGICVMLVGAAYLVFYTKLMRTENIQE